ncbi:chemotaxis protein [Sphingomonas sp. ABOLD]|uniref:Methyl-accepting chemotaxis protein n=1 Tax=Sphingomonas trueperi TaxID=53317 RepID=A0A7X5XYZ5_9SPHN|nr:MULTISPECIES: methyl-accepting chemotaxis protein [Sphingomonas]NJB97974.1 methyl-accepting chemotaxis protein [Sphingomonas trueperi]RSV43089.1 chemotaxis protein [Sphingomonas sp. ABOLD]
MHWFESNAPIRQKTLIAFGSLAFIGLLTAIVAAVLPALWGIGVAFAGSGSAMLLGLRYRRAICDPYVTTVVRMEALAAGDLQSEIRFTDYTDCVGRMTKAMFTFRDAAIVQQKMAETQAEVVRVVGEHLAALAQGDLTRPIEERFPTDYETLRENYNGTLDALGALIGAVSRSTESIRTGSVQIASASEELAQRTQSTAANLEQTSAAATQMDQRLRVSAAAAVDTAQSASKAITTVSTGRTMAEEAVNAMTRVSEDAKGIDSVIEGLDKIAFQTRVLAMNAAVEAGRAGEAGRGFAVVADLVSALAMRAEEEAKRAKEQLTVTQTGILSAVDVVRRVDGALIDISGNVQTVHELVERMAADNQEQSSAITEITGAIASMDHGTQQNAAMVEEASAAARNLSAEVSILAENAAKFTVAGGSSPHHPALRTPRRSPPALQSRPARQAPAEAWASF